MAFSNNATCIWLWSVKNYRWYLIWKGQKEKLPQGWKYAYKKFPDAFKGKFEESPTRPQRRWWDR